MSENQSEESAIKDFPMEAAMMSDMVALSLIEAMVSSDLGKSLDKPMEQMTAIGFAFAKEILKQREEWLKPKEPEEPKPTIVTP